MFLGGVWVEDGFLGEASFFEIGGVFFGGGIRWGGEIGGWSFIFIVCLNLEIIVVF